MATMTVACQCGRVLKVGPDLAGRRGKCPSCGEVLEIPVTSIAVSAEQAKAAQTPHLDADFTPPSVLVHESEPLNQPDIAEQCKLGPAVPPANNPILGIASIVASSIALLLVLATVGNRYAISPALVDQLRRDSWAYRTASRSSSSSKPILRISRQPRWTWQRRSSQESIPCSVSFWCHAKMPSLI